MKPNKQQAREAWRAYDLYRKNYLKGDEQTFAFTLDEEISRIWTVESKVFDSKADVVKSVHDTVDQIEDAAGILLGKFEGVAFETRQLQFNPGDRIVLYTDGVTEAMNAAQEMYEEARFFEFLATYKPESVSNLVRGVIVDVLQHMGKAEQSDDITVFALEYRGSENGNGDGAQKNNCPNDKSL